uniref:Fasciculation and elongation protein zeta 2 n=1 Tax=Panagrolaimus sp. JU765 TaxID=591449 RepID=A0AC34RQR2_9BILA
MVAAEEIMDEKDLAIPDVPLVCLDDEFDADFSKIDELTPVKAEEAKAVLNLLNESCSQSSSSGGDTDATLSGSLEDLVGCFDQKVNQVLKDLKEDTNQMAPVQIRTQDEIMSESQVWWTLTGNYGNILPLDFSKSQIRKNQIEALNLSSPRDEPARSDAGYDEEESRQQMDLHQLISQQMPLHGDHLPVSADQVIEEIDEIMQTCDLMHSMTTDRTAESVDSMYSSMRSPFTELVNELAHRDELVYEKEVKNKFVTLLVNIQDQRRKNQSRKKKLLGKLDGSASSQALTASIPFDENTAVLDVATLESLIKILDAINEDSPQVPNLLTDYILNVVCPSTETSMIA